MEASSKGVKFSQAEIKLMKEKPDCRVATISQKGWPQVTAVIHVFDNGVIYFVTEKTTKKVQNLRHNNKIAVIIDTYQRSPISINIQGTAEIIEKGEEYEKAAKLLTDRHEYYQANGVARGTDVIIKVTPVRKTSSGI
jgi:nitroimidazol reductase NimA-like FMN-containing flavoprotein (pyridoxamine 5'-phosphate oxidase superfamily)